MLVSGQNKFAVLGAELEMSNGFYDQVTEELKNITASGLYKSECVIATRQGATVRGCVFPSGGTERPGANPSAT